MHATPKTELQPLVAWYAAARAKPPRVTFVAADRLPAPYRSLLAHDRDMTSTLEKFHAAPIHLRVLSSERRANIYRREVVLAANGTGDSVEFGAIRIHLDALPTAARKLVLEAKRPLGAILNVCRVAYTSHPNAFFRIRSEKIMNQALGLRSTRTLYGRSNELRTARGKRIAEIVEILPPVKRRSNGAMESRSNGKRQQRIQSITPSLRDSNFSFDCVIVGAGPAGCTAAAILAEKGWRVALLEREKFPRYHIGESLMPYCFFPLERIGMIEKMKQSNFPKKYSVQFIGTSGKKSRPFYFFQHLKHDAATTWQVLRSEFDQMLLENARAKGATVFERATARELIRDNGSIGGVRAAVAKGKRKDFRAPITLDATGRDGFASVRLGWRERDPQLDKIALWTYWRGGKREAGLDEGATTIAFLPEKGWFWYIPLANDMVSVGIVAEQEYLFRDSRDPKVIFEREQKKNRWIADALSVGKRAAKFWVTGEFSYRSRRCATNGLVLLGDAFAFLDPVFSSGVFLALKSGELAADAVDAALRDADFSEDRFAKYGSELCRGIEAMRKLVYAFYDKEFSFRELIENHPEVRGDLTDCLIGNLFRDFDDLFAAVGKFARLPSPLPYETMEAAIR